MEMDARTVCLFALKVIKSVRSICVYGNHPPHPGHPTDILANLDNLFRKGEWGKCASGKEWKLLIRNGKINFIKQLCGKVFPCAALLLAPLIFRSRQILWQQKKKGKMENV